MRSNECKCGQMTLNEPKWIQMSLNEPKSIPVSLNEPKWAQNGLKWTEISLAVAYMGIIQKIGHITYVSFLGRNTLLLNNPHVGGGSLI